MTAKRTILLAQINPGLQIVGTPTPVFPGVAYSFTFTARGGVAGTYKFTQTGTLPTGIAFADNGDGTATLAGTTTDTGEFPITIQLGNSGQYIVSENFSLSVPALTLQLAQAGIVYKGVALTAGQLKLLAHGGTGAGYTYAITSGMPAGLTLNPSTGELTGTPTTQTVYTVVATVTDSASNTAAVTAQVVVQTTLYGIDVTPPDADADFGYSYQLSIGGATGTVSYALLSGTMPGNVTCSSTGLLSAGLVSGLTGSGYGQSNFIIRATDSGTGCTLDIPLKIYVYAYDTAGASPNYAITINVPTTLNNGQFGGKKPISYTPNFGSSTTNDAITVAV